MAKSITQTAERTKKLALVMALVDVEPRSYMQLQELTGICKRTLYDLLRQLRLEGKIVSTNEENVLYWTTDIPKEPEHNRRVYRMDDPKRIEINKEIARSQSLGRPKHPGIRSGMAMFLTL